MTFLEFIVTRVNNELGLEETAAGFCSSEKIMQFQDMGRTDKDVWQLLKSELLKLGLSSELPRQLKNTDFQGWDWGRHLCFSKLLEDSDISKGRAHWFMAWATVNQGQYSEPGVGVADQNL